MIEQTAFEAVLRHLNEDPTYRIVLTEQITGRTVDPDLLDRLIMYARSRQATIGQAMARQVLTDAGVSWEAL